MARRFWAMVLLGFAAPAAAERADPRILPENPSYARNAACARIDPPPPERMPLSQGDSAICFAYATADMVSQRVGRRVSALDVANTFYFADPAQLARARDPRVARHVARRPDLLDEIARERNRVDVNLDGNPTRKPFFDKLEGGEEDLASLMLNVKGLCLARDLPSDDGYTHVWPYLKARRTAAGLAPPINYCARATGATVEKMRDPVADRANAEWFAHVERRCRRFVSPVPLLPVSYRIAAHQEEFIERKRRGDHATREERARMFAMIDYALDHKRNPTIGYSFYLLQARAADDPDEYADHSSAVIGRRKVGGACQYLVQDNTGELCFKFRPEIAARCTLGRIWLTESELADTLYSVIYLR